MQSLAVTIPSVQSRDWTRERRAKAAAAVQHFILELATDPLLPAFTARHLRAAYPLHAKKPLVIWLQLARSHRWTSRQLHTAGRSFLHEGLVRRCRGDQRCWLHAHLNDPQGELTS
jgi:hypothetical protein